MDVGQPLVGNPRVFVDFLSVLVRVVFFVAIFVGIGSGLGWAAARTVLAAQRTRRSEWSCMLADSRQSQTDYEMRKWIVGLGAGEKGLLVLNEASKILSSGRKEGSTAQISSPPPHRATMRSR